jgi:cytochrome c oxidase assembly factor CtaG
MAMEAASTISRARNIGRWLTHPVVAFGLYNMNMWVWHAPALLDALPPARALIAMHWLNLALMAPVWILLALLGPGLARTLLSQRRWGLVTAGAVTGIVLLLSALTIFSSSPWALSSQPHNPLHTLMDLLFILTALLYWAPILNPVPQLRRIAPLFGILYLFMSTQPMMALGALVTFAAHPLYSVYASAPRLLGVLTPMTDQQLAGLIMWLVMDIPLLIGISILFFRWMRQQEREQERQERMERTLTPDEEVIWQPPTTAADL